MNPNSKSIKILCFGDSNTWGQLPFEHVRYKQNEYWTSLLQAKFDKIGGGEFNYQIIEEGLGARTAGNIDLDKPKRNGLKYFKTNIINQIAFDIGIIALGTNDLKTKYNRSPQQIYNDLMSYQDLVMQYLPEKTKLIYLLPPSISKDVAGFDNYHQKFQELVNLFEKTQYHKSPLKNNSQLSHLQLDWRSMDSRIRENDKDTLIKVEISFIDLSDFKVTGADGLHFSISDHKKVAEIIYKKLLGHFD